MIDFRAGRERCLRSHVRFWVGIPQASPREPATMCLRCSHGLSIPDPEIIRRNDWGNPVVVLDNLRRYRTLYGWSDHDSARYRLASRTAERAAFYLGVSV